MKTVCGYRKSYKMAYFDKRSLQIVYEVEDKERIKDSVENAVGKRTPVSDRIMKWILKGVPQAEQFISNNKEF